MVDYKQDGVHFMVSERDARESHARCSECNVQLLYVVMPSGKRNPLDIEHAERLDNGELRCVSHFATCPKAERFRAKNKKPKTACPIEGCEGSVRQSELLCPLCWKVVPKRLRDEVWKTWKAVQAGGARDAWKTYEAAAAAAIASVRTRKASRSVRQIDAFGDHQVDPG